jgi:hypothetical protein
LLPLPWPLVAKKKKWLPQLLRLPLLLLKLSKMLALLPLLVPLLLLPVPLPLLLVP